MNKTDILSKKVGSIRVRPNQFEMIVEAMEQNPMLNKPSTTYEVAKRNKDWEELSRKLNSKGGAIKSVKSWQKTWRDKKVEVKRRYKTVMHGKMKTTGEPNEKPQLTDLEKRIAVLIGLDLAKVLDKEQIEARPRGLVIPKVENCPTSLPSGSFRAIAPRSDQPFTQESYQTDLLPDTPSRFPDIEESHQLESLPSQFIISQVNSIQDVDAQKVVDGQTGMAMALTRFAEALERQNELRERALEIKKQKADTFIEILSVLKDKL